MPSPYIADTRSGGGGGFGGSAVPGLYGTASQSGVGLPDYANIANLMNTLQMSHNAGRIPGAAGLEDQSSKDIADLLNPGSMFPDVNRMAAEHGAAAGIPGSANAFGVGLKMSDEERLKRIALGESLLTGADARNPTAPLPPIGDFVLTPEQQLQAYLRQQGGGNGPHITSSGGGGAPAGPGVYAGGGYSAPQDYHGTGPDSTGYIRSGTTNNQMYPNPNAPLLPIDGSGGNYDFGGGAGEYFDPISYLFPEFDTQSPGNSGFDTGE